jgi:hypothetical protein
LLSSTGASQPLLKAIAALATEARGVIPPLDDLDAWTGDKWLGANFGQSLQLATFRVGLTTLSNHPDLVVDETHVQRLIKATIKPLKEGFDAETTKPGAASASILTALTTWEQLRDQLLPGMVGGALQSVAADRNSFLGAVVSPVGEKKLDLLIGGMVNGALDEVENLNSDDLLQRRA